MNRCYSIGENVPENILLIASHMDFVVLTHFTPTSSGRDVINKSHKTDQICISSDFLPPIIGVHVHQLFLLIQQIHDVTDTSFPYCSVNISCAYKWLWFELLLYIVPLFRCVCISSYLLEGNIIARTQTY